MHELSIAQALVEQVQKIAHESGSTQILRITLRIGKLAGVDPEALSFAFPLVAEGTCLEKTQLVFISVEPELRCRSCGKSVETDFVSACVHCGSQDLDLKQGRELLIESIEMED